MCSVFNEKGVFCARNGQFEKIVSRSHSERTEELVHTRGAIYNLDRWMSQKPGRSDRYR